MKKLLCVLMFGLMFGQDTNVSILNNTEKMLLYNAERKNPAAAVIYEFYYLHLVMDIRITGKRAFFIALFQLAYLWGDLVR